MLLHFFLIVFLIALPSMLASTSLRLIQRNHHITRYKYHHPNTWITWNPLISKRNLFTSRTLHARENLLKIGSIDLRELPFDVQKQCTKYLSSPSISQEKKYINYVNIVSSLPWLSKPTNTDFDRFVNVLNEKLYILDDVEIRERIKDMVYASQYTGVIAPILILGRYEQDKELIVHILGEALNRPVIILNRNFTAEELLGKSLSHPDPSLGMIMTKIKQTQNPSPILYFKNSDAVSVKGNSLYVMEELLDSDKRKKFLDYYVGIPFDLTSALIICEANRLESLSENLVSKFNIINMPYVQDKVKEKFVKHHLIEKYKRSTLQEIEFSDVAIKKIISDYSTNLSDMSKCVEIIITSTPAGEQIKLVTEKDVTDILGLSQKRRPMVYKKRTLGVTGILSSYHPSMTLATVEATVRWNGDPSTLVATGNILPDFAESIKTSYCFAKSYVQEITEGTSTFFNDHCIHLHVSPFDLAFSGESAGVAIVTSILSLALQIPVPTSILMTGEISLNGNVYKVGGIRDKVLGAKQRGVRELLLPLENKVDYESLSVEEKENMSVYFVEHYSEVFDHLFQSDDQVIL